MSKHGAEANANTSPTSRRKKPGSSLPALDLLGALALEGGRPLRPAASQLIAFAEPVLALFGQGTARDLLERLTLPTDKRHQDDRRT